MEVSVESKSRHIRKGVTRNTVSYSLIYSLGGTSVDGAQPVGYLVADKERDLRARSMREAFTGWRPDAVRAAGPRVANGIGSAID